jgi:molybdopterin converting factor small subunit
VVTKVVRLRLFGPAGQRAGRGADELLATACDRYGPAFAELLPLCRVWVNGAEAGTGTLLRDGDEVAVLPPTSGG